MTNSAYTGSFSNFSPEDVIERIDIHLLRIEAIKIQDKKEWFEKQKSILRKKGIWPFRKTFVYLDEELEIIWEKGFVGDDYYTFSPKYKIWDTWDATIARFTKIKNFCKLAIQQGNITVSLSKDDAVFAFDWE